MEIRHSRIGSIKALARANDLELIQLRRWERQLPQLQEALEDARSAPATRTTLRQPPLSCLENVKDTLLLWLSDLHNQGMPVSTSMVVLKAASLDATFARKRKHAKYQSIHRFLKANKFVIHAKTNEAQALPEMVHKANNIRSGFLFFI